MTQRRSRNALNLQILLPWILVMSADLPSIRFPRPALALPPSPESTIEPLPAGDDPRLAGANSSLTDLQWYLYSALQNNDSYSDDYFSWGSSHVHMGDVLEPVAYPPENNPGTEEEDWAYGWEMSCLRCPSTPDQGKPDRSTMTGYPFCDEGTLSLEVLTSYTYIIIGPDLEVPVSTDEGADKIMACVVQLKLQEEWVRNNAIQAERYSVTSQPFMVHREERGGDPSRSLRRFRYNVTYPEGVSDDQVQEPGLSFPFPTATPTTTRGMLDFWGTTSTAGYTTGINNPWKEENNRDDQNSTKTGILIGVIVPLALFVGIITLCCKRKRDKQQKTNVSAPVPRNLNPVADAQRQMGFPERAYIARRNRAAAEEAEEASAIQAVEAAEAAAAMEASIINRTRFLDGHRRPPARTTTTVQADPEELPPAYHNVVTNVERMEIERRMQAERTAPQGWPPAYRDAQSAASSSTSRPPPVASVPTQNRHAYPALPPSPPRRI